MNCLLRLKDTPHYRRDAFTKGLQALGYNVVPAISHITPDDLLICWNRYDDADNWAKRFKASGAKTIVVENGYFGNSWLGDNWFSMSREHHNGAGFWPQDEGRRWESFGAEVAPYKPFERKKEILLLPQRSIGPRGVAMPRTWVADMAKFKLPPCRVRPHPGAIERVPLAEDLGRAKCVVTWGSGAALKAIIAGIPCVGTWDKWIGYPACIPMAKNLDWNNLQPPDPMPMFKRLAGALWRISEIESGFAIHKVLYDC